MTNNGWLDELFGKNTDHQALENRDAVNAHPASAVGYVADQASQLANSTTVQHAIDTLDKKASLIPTSHSQLSGRDDAEVHPAESIRTCPPVPPWP